MGIFNDEDRELSDHRIEYAKGPGDKVLYRKTSPGEVIYSYSSTVLSYGCRFMTREQKLLLTIFQNDIMVLQMSG